MLALAILLVAISFYVQNWVSAPLILFGVFFWFQFVFKLSTEANKKAIENAHLAVDDVFHGKRFFGKESIVVDSIRLDSPREPGPLLVRQLCRTNKGSWFAIEFATRSGSGKPVDVRMTDVVDEQDARAWLLRENHKAFQEYFGPLPEYELA
jgi:hypothetical protein